MSKSVIIRDEYLEYIDELPEKDRKDMLWAISMYQLTGEEPTGFTGISAITFKFIKTIVDKDMKKAKANRSNGVHGGRPKGVYAMDGRVIPDGYVKGRHFLYLIYDTDLHEYKIGETHNLVERRRTIKRPTGFLKVVDFRVGSPAECKALEEEILMKYNGGLSGEWLDINEMEKNEIIRKYFKCADNEDVADECKNPNKPKLSQQNPQDSQIIPNNPNEEKEEKQEIPPAPPIEVKEEKKKRLSKDSPKKDNLFLPDDDEFNRFNDWLRTHCPYVLKVTTQMSAEEYHKLVDNGRYTKRELCDALLDLNNWKDFPKKRTNVYRSTLDELKKKYGDRPIK